ncbi:MAG TPA: zinc ABC transporter ATP-binding protein [Peptococcaceae bacterium]|nr:MAG: ABC transporter related [Clostridia bacterium 41_269]HBT19828.1 zinc ABC transporter ATP-binding protein [Peptococcaceae bacterium]
MQREKVMEKIIEVKDITFSYGSKTILENASLTVFRSDFLAVVGPNGSGKSTLIKLILGLLKPQKGKILIFNTPVEAFNQWKKIGYLSQRAAFFNSHFPATVREVVGAQASAHLGFLKPMRPKDWERVEKSLEMVGLSELGNCLVGRLSGGQQQKVMLARILVAEPELLFLDEPMVGLDPESQESLYMLLEKLHKEQGLTIVMVTHDISGTVKRVNRMVCIHQNKILEHDPQLYKDKKITHSYITQLYHLH